MTFCHKVEFWSQFVSNSTGDHKCKYAFTDLKMAAEWSNWPGRIITYTIKPLNRQMKYRVRVHEGKKRNWVGGKG